jgi:hypothetical protein
MSISYITNEAGEKTAVIVPIEEWNKINPTAESIEEWKKKLKPMDLSGLSGVWKDRTEDPVAVIREMREERDIGL